MTDDTPSENPRSDARPATTAMRKAYSHPLRRRIARILAGRDHARAADIAAELDMPANSNSFHLRVLGDAGLIEEAPEHARDRRDRVWKPVRGAWDIGSPDHPVVDEILGGAVIAALAEDHIEMLRRVVAWAPDYVAGRATGVHGTFDQHNLRLTESEFTELLKRIGELLKEAEESTTQPRRTAGSGRSTSSPPTTRSDAVAGESQAACQTLLIQFTQSEKCCWLAK